MDSLSSAGLEKIAIVGFLVTKYKDEVLYKPMEFNWSPFSENFLYLEEDEQIISVIPALPGCLAIRDNKSKLIGYENQGAFRPYWTEIVNQPKESMY